MKLNDTQIDYLKRLMDGGNQEIPTTLEMLTNQTFDQCSATTQVISIMRVIGSTGLGAGPLATVTCDIHGYVECEFLFLQNQADFETLCQVMTPTLTDGAVGTVNEATEYLIPNWLKEQRVNEPDIEALQEQMKDVVTETASVLFGTYLTVLNTKCQLATYQDFPETRLKDRQQSVLEDALSRNRKDSNTAFCFEIACRVEPLSFKICLLMLPQLSALQTMLDTAKSPAERMAPPEITFEPPPRF